MHLTRHGQKMLAAVVTIVGLGVATGSAAAAPAVVINPGAVNWQIGTGGLKLTLGDPVTTANTITCTTVNPFASNLDNSGPAGQGIVNQLQFNEPLGTGVCKLAGVTRADVQIQNVLPDVLLANKDGAGNFTLDGTKSWKVKAMNASSTWWQSTGGAPLGVSIPFVNGGSPSNPGPSRLVFNNTLIAYSSGAGAVGQPLRLTGVVNVGSGVNPPLRVLN